MFKTAVAQLLISNRESTNNNVLDIISNTPSIEDKSDGVIRLELELPGGHTYFVKIYDPIKRLSDSFIDIVSHSTSDEKLRDLILDHAIGLSLPVLEGFMDSVYPSISQKNPEFQLDKGKIKFSGIWRLSFVTDSERWLNFSHYLTEKHHLLEKHIKNHEGAWDSIIKKFKIRPQLNKG